jgi:hypothetical protein
MKVSVIVQCALCGQIIRLNHNYLGVKIHKVKIMWLKPKCLSILNTKSIFLVKMTLHFEAYRRSKWFVNAMQDLVVENWVFQIFDLLGTTSQNFGQLSLWAISVPDVEEQVHQLASRQWFEWNFGIRVIHKVRRLGGARTASFGLIGHQTCDWEWKFYKTK